MSLNIIKINKNRIDFWKQMGKAQYDNRDHIVKNTVKKKIRSRWVSIGKEEMSFIMCV